MGELLAHLFGDYVFQNHWMAQNKTKAWVPALVHATVYTMPFRFLTADWRPLLIIWATHLLIDRFRLAQFWTEFYGVGCKGELWATWGALRIVAANPDSTTMEEAIEAQQSASRAPAWLAVWLMIIVDNTVHLSINHLALSLWN